MPRLLVDSVAVAEVEVADRYLSRLRGLIGRRRLPEALVLDPANSVHGVGMLRTIEVAVVDADGVVLSTGRLRPGGMTRPRRGGRRVLEAPVGSFARWQLRPGSRICVV